MSRLSLSGDDHEGKRVTYRARPGAVRPSRHAEELSIGTGARPDASISEAAIHAQQPLAQWPQTSPVGTR